MLTLDATGLNAPTRTRSPGAWPRADNDRLNDIVWGLPLFPYMDVAVTPLARHAYEGSVAGRCSR
ncbi:MULTISPECIES: muconolactone Delta-isomerase family protein [unclassified Streptomyces]|uniref:muconolactone Delta-isomerase family protein n=1 Tax=unclassified Streptomyces TaxID=2593676 RepID=UPI00224F75DE|nr:MULTISPECIES: muconolactone Delta-isomerase family protein [unclassified Streptomyces]MCX4405333.1 muconolactone Delta-isomerase family protein [Streptomyces sp. NBC_01764]MCX5190116.1 muconolactone Delta-isomerase family protein [Streptomyces sp. NBC_00268]